MRVLLGRALALTGLALLGLMPAARAQTLVLGGSDGDNLLPFGSNPYNPPGQQTYVGEYQQLYSHTAFSGPVTLTGVAFASGNLPGGALPLPAVYDLTLSLSTAATTVQAPAADFAANEGADFTTVLSGTQSVSLQGDHSFDIVLPFTQSFVYDPSQGDLLLDLVMNSASVPPGAGVAAGTSADSSRVFNTSVFGGDPKTAQTDPRNNYGLLTRFDTRAAAVPEPGTLVLLGAGLLPLALAARRRGTRSPR